MAPGRSGAAGEHLLGGRRGTRASGEDDNPEECQVCVTNFDECERRPRNLPCGHTFCSPCVASLARSGRLTCPACRAHHSAPAHFPISYVTEALIRRLRGAELTRPTTHPRRRTTDGGASARSLQQQQQQQCTTGVSEKLRCLLQEEKTTVNNVIRKCRRVQSQLDEYHKQLAGWRDHHQQLEDSLLALLQQNRAAKDLLGQEDSQVLDMKEQGGQGEQELSAVCERLDAPSSPQGADAAITTADHRTVAAGTWLHRCQQMFPNAEIITTSRKVREATVAALDTAKVALEAVTVEEGVPAAPTTALDDPAAAIQERVQAVTQDPLTLKAEQLRGAGRGVAGLVRAGRVVAQHPGGEGKGERTASITEQAGRLYLHCLQDLPPPHHAAILQMSEVVPPAPPCLVFLDLAWPGSPARRVHIRLSLDTPRGRQCLLLCTGQRGPSYRGTKLWRLGRRGQPGECVWGGDYQTSDGRGGAALLPDLDQGKYWRSGRAGAVCGGWCEGKWGALFIIATRDWEDGVQYDGAFGEVEGGLHVVKEAAKHRPIKDVTVVDCGVVLSG